MAGGALQDIPKQPGAAGRVGPLLARRVKLTRQAGDDFTHAGIGARVRFTLGQAGEMRLRVGVVSYSIPPRWCVESTASALRRLQAVPFCPGSLNGNQVNKGVDFTLLNGDTDQRRDHRFAYRAREVHRVVSVLPSARYFRATLPSFSTSIPLTFSRFR